MSSAAAKIEISSEGVVVKIYEITKLFANLKSNVIFTVLRILMLVHHIDIMLFYTANRRTIQFYDFHGFMSSESPASLAGLV